MKIYYDSKLAQWYHCYLEKQIRMGGIIKPLNYRAESSEDIYFDLRLKENQIGPVIGILTARNKNGHIAGNGPLFSNLQKKLISLGGISFIFTLEDVGEEWVDGYIYLPEHAKWLKVRTPFPDLVYNRIPFRKAEKNPDLTSFFTFLADNKIPYFNPFFINKMELYELLQNHPHLKNYLPETLIPLQKQDLDNFLAKHESIYLKPAHSSRGKGIFRLSIQKNGHLLLEGIRMSELYPSFQSFWNEWGTALIEGQYIAQVKVVSALYEGKRFDLRILAHAHQHSYIVTGVGIRQSQDQDITTHIPAGGRLLPYELLQSPEHDEFIKTIVSEIGRALTAEFGYFGEFSVDAGIDVSGRYCIYEVNSKPMSFDETEIEERKLDQLCLLFLQLTDFD